MSLISDKHFLPPIAKFELYKRQHQIFYTSKSVYKSWEVLTQHRCKNNLNNPEGAVLNLMNTMSVRAENIEMEEKIFFSRYSHR